MEIADFDAILAVIESIDRGVLNKALGERQAFAEMIAAWTSAGMCFIPRPDDPENFDQQHSFCYNRDQVSFLIGGNAAGTTEAAAFKTAIFLLEQQPPPRKDTPFWVVAPTLELATGVCWEEKLLGHGHIPRTEIDWNRCQWTNQKNNQPRAITLRPWAESRGGDPDKNWRIEFKSVEQGRTLMQARSIGGFWFSEQFPLDIFLEVLRGCRECMFPGGQFAEFTPIDPELSLWVEEMMEKLPEGWAVYRANTRANRANLAEGWFESFFGTVPDELTETRMTGQLAGFEGVIYPSFTLASHVIPEGRVLIPPGATHAAGTDWGASAEHPHVTLLGCRDGLGDWLIYDEYFSARPGATTLEHAQGVMEMLVRWNWPTVPTPKSLLKRVVSAESLDPDDPRAGCEWAMNYADPSRPDKINEWSGLGIPTMPASNAVLPGIEYVQSMMKRPPGARRPRLLVSSRCRNLIKQLRKYRWLRGRKPTSDALNPSVPTAAPLKRDDDACDAGRYLIYSADRLIGSGPDSLSKWPQQDKAKSVQLQRRGVSRKLERMADELTRLESQR